MVNLQAWAEVLSRSDCPPDRFALHVKDTLTALLTGLKTSEGQALAAHYSDREAIADRAAAAAAIARLSESDDIHLPSCVTPGAIAIPVTLVLGLSPETSEFRRAVCASYAAGLSLGVAIGGAKALAAGVWPTRLVAPAMAAVVAGMLPGFPSDRRGHAIALALAQASGRIGRPSGARTGRWFLLAEAIASGIRAADAAADGIDGDLSLLSEAWLAAKAGHPAVDIDVFGRNERTPSLTDTGFKPFPVARQALPAILAFQTLLARGLDAAALDAVQVFVPAMNAAMLNRPVVPEDRLSRLSHIGLQLACAALAPERLSDPERPSSDALAAFARRVTVQADAALDGLWPDRWGAKVVVRRGSAGLEETVLSTTFDHDAPGLDARLPQKWARMLGPGEPRDFDALLAAPWDTAGFWQWLQTAVTPVK